MTALIPSAAGAADMVLEPSGRRAGADSGDPQTSVREISSDGAIKVGVWECTPGGWPIENRADTEICTIVSGAGAITDAGGDRRELGPGSVVTLPKGWSGRWDITETLRKVYVLVG